jgi:hypothetical protein
MTILTKQPVLRYSKTKPTAPGDWWWYRLDPAPLHAITMAPQVPIRARYRHTHWVGARLVGDQVQIFDINCMCVGGWVDVAEWSGSVVPWLLREAVPRSNGEWSLTHVAEVEIV